MLFKKIFNILYSIAPSFYFTRIIDVCFYYFIKLFEIYHIFWVHIIWTQSSQVVVVLVRKFSESCDVTCSSAGGSCEP